MTREKTIHKDIFEADDVVITNRVSVDLHLSNRGPAFDLIDITVTGCHGDTIYPDTKSSVQIQSSTLDEINLLRTTATNGTVEYLAKAIFTHMVQNRCLSKHYGTPQQVVGVIQEAINKTGITEYQRGVDDERERTIRFLSSWIESSKEYGEDPTTIATLTYIVDEFQTNEHRIDQEDDNE